MELEMLLSQLKQGMWGKNLAFVWSQAPHRMLLTQTPCLHIANAPRLNMLPGQMDLSPPNPQKPGTEEQAPWEGGSEQSKGKDQQPPQTQKDSPHRSVYTETRLGLSPSIVCSVTPTVNLGQPSQKDMHCRSCSGSTPFWSWQKSCWQRK